MKLRGSFFGRRCAADDALIPDVITKVAADWVARRDAGLTAQEERGYASWLEAEPRHREAMQRLDFAWTALDQPMRTGAAAAVLFELGRRARRRRQGGAFATAALVLLVGLAAGWRMSRSTADVKSLQLATAAVLLPTLQSLPDGSVAELRDGGEIAVDFTPNQRRVELRRGEVYFKVAKNPARPFVVVVGAVEFRAVGTAFSVNRENLAIELLVTEGTVAVGLQSSAGSPTGNTPPVLVGAGGGATVKVAPEGDGPQISAVPNADLLAKLAWRSPRLEFSGTRLIEAVTLINQHNRLQFIIEDPELANVRVSGIFGAANTAAFIGLLEAGFNVEHERRGDREIVLRLRR